MTAELPKRWEYAAVVIIMIAAFLLRFVSLGSNPPGLFHDEFEKGYTALELISTGHHGVLGSDGISTSRFLPLFIEVYSGHDKTSALYQYLSSPVVGIFGLGPWTTRFVAALAGWFSVILVWLFARRSLGPAAALVALTAMAFQPTGVAFSRWAQQGILLLPLVTGGVWALWEVPTARPSHKRALALVSALLLGIAAYAYAPARLIVPLLLVCFALSIGWRAIKRERSAYILSAILFLLFWIPLFFFTLTAGSSRLSRVGVFGDGVGSGIGTAIGNYLAHFNPLFLAISGDANARHGLPGAGLVGWGGAILLLAGIVAVILEVWKKRDHARPGLFILLWFFAAPAAAALTNEGIPHALRSNLMLPAAALLAGCSVLLLNHLPRKRLVLVFVLSILLLDAFQAVRGLYLQATGPKAPWEAGLIPALQQGISAEGACYVSGAIPYANYAILFASETDPRLYQESGFQALPCILIPPGNVPPLRPGDVYIAPPGPPVPLEYYEEFVLIYQQVEGELTARRP